MAEQDKSQEDESDLEQETNHDTKHLAAQMHVGGRVTPESVILQYHYHMLDADSEADEKKKVTRKRPRKRSNLTIHEVTTIILSQADDFPKLTIQYLVEKLTPYLGAIFTVQHIIDEVLGRPIRDLRIREVSQHSPISVSLEGVADAVEVIRETVVPWRRKHVVQMAFFLEQEKQVEIESKKAEILEKRANAAKERAEAGKFAAEAKRQIQEAERIKLENDRLRLDLQRSKIELAIEMINRIAPNISELDRISFLTKILQPLDVLVFSELEIREV